MSINTAGILQSGGPDVHVSPGLMGSVLVSQFASVRYDLCLTNQGIDENLAASTTFVPNASRQERLRFPRP